jgi:hypothetical protein
LLAVRYRAALRTNDLIGGRYLLSPFTRAVLIMAVSTVIAISASMSVIYVTDLVLPDFDARFDNYAFAFAIPLGVSPLLVYPLVHVNYRMEMVQA